MTGSTGVVVLLVAWIAGIAAIARLVTHKPRSAARTGSRGRRLRARPGAGGMSERFTPPPRYVPDVISVSVSELPRDELAAALAALTPAVLCTLCVTELKQARAAGQPDPEVLPGIAMGDIVVDGRPSIGIVCEVRHPLAVGTAQPMVAQAAQSPDGGLG